MSAIIMKNALRRKQCAGWRLITDFFSPMHRNSRGDCICTRKAGKTALLLFGLAGSCDWAIFSRPAEAAAWITDKR